MSKPQAVDIRIMFDRTVDVPEKGATQFCYVFDFPLKQSVAVYLHKLIDENTEREG